MSAQAVFLYPAELLYRFLLSLFGMGSTGLGHPLDLIVIVIVALVIWFKLAQGVLALFKHMIGFQSRPSR